MTAYGISEVVRALIGETMPCGDSAIDHNRAINLLKLTCLTDSLLRDIKFVARLRNVKGEESVQSAGECAYNSLDGWRKEITRLLAEIDEEGTKNG